MTNTIHLNKDEAVAVGLLCAVCDTTGPCIHDNELVYFNINEIGQAYDQHDALPAALAVLRQFPNDVVVIAVDGSPAADLMKAECAE